MTPRIDRLAFGLACGLAGLLVIFRSAVWIWWPQSHFDSDQAVFGLMAKHISQGHAFPLVMYGQNYMLAVESWLAAPLFAVIGPSVTALKLPLLLLNLVTAVLVIRILIGDGQLSPAAAVIASLFFLLPPPATASRLVEAQGGNVEPLLYAMMLWLLRRRPIAFGVIAGIGVANREFTAYAIVALIAVEAWQGRFADAGHWRTRALSLAVAAAVLVAIGLVKPHTDLMGPTSAGSPAAAAVAAAPFRPCMQPAEWWPNARWVVERNLATLFGWRGESLSQYANSTAAIGHGAAGLALAALGLFAVVALAGDVARRRWRPAGGAPVLSMYFVIIGIESVVGAATLPCIARDAMLVRYILVALVAPVGIAAYLLHPTRARPLRLAAGAAVIVWAAFGMRDTGDVLTEYRTRPPKDELGEFARFLESHGARYGTAPYWTAYAVDFISDERVILAPDGFPRIREYETLVAQHAAGAVRISEETVCSGASALQFGKWCVRRGPD